MNSDLASSEKILESTEPKREAPLVPIAKRKRKRWLWLVPLVLIPVGAVVYQKITPVAEVATPAQALPVTTTTAERVESYKIQRTYTGELVARRSSNLGFERGGTVVAILVDEGDRVTPGQPLARLDTRSLEAQRQELIAQRAQAEAQLQELQKGPRPEDIAAARAAVADIENQLELSRRKTSRREYLHREGAISREDLDREFYNTGSLQSRLREAQSNLNRLLTGTRSEQIAAQTARVRQLDASIKGIDVELSKSVLRAPFGGKVSQRAIDEGTAIANGAMVLKLVEQGSLEARIGVPSDRAANLKTGSRQQVKVGETVYSARMTALLPEIDSTSRTATIVLELEPNSALQVGQTAQLLLEETQAAQGFWLPSTALVPRDRGLWSIYILAEDSTDSDTYTVARRDVEVLHTEGERVLVRGTIQPRDRAITSGTHRIVVGQKVKAITNDQLPITN